MRWNRYRLMDEPPDPEGDGKGGEGGEGDPPPPATIPLDVIPEEFRDRPASEIRFLLQHMASGIGRQNTEVEQLRARLSQLESKPPEPPPPDPDDEKPLEELILEDPKKAMRRFLKEEGYLDEFSSFSTRLGEAEIQSLAKELPQFHEHEERVRELLKESRVNPTRSHVLAAYKISLGEKAMEEAAKSHRGSVTEPPSTPPPPPPPGGSQPLSDLEREVMRAHGVDDEKEWARMRDQPLSVKVPV